MELKKLIFDEECLGGDVIILDTIKEDDNLIYEVVLKKYTKDEKLILDTYICDNEIYNGKEFYVNDFEIAK